MEEAPNDLHMAVCAVVVGVVCGTGFALCDASMGGGCVCGGQDSFSGRWVSVGRVKDVRYGPTSNRDISLANTASGICADGKARKFDLFSLI